MALNTCEQTVQELPPLNAAVSFIENHITVNNDVGRRGVSTVRYIPALDEFGDEEDANEAEREDPFMEVDVQNEKENFYGAMDAYEKKRNPKAEAKTRIASWSWEEVLVDLNKAKVVYKEKGKIRRLLDKLKKSIPTLRSWLQLLPDGDYGSIICGAFKLILDAASRHTDVQENLYEALARIPDRIGHATRYQQIYKQYRNHGPLSLKRKIATLYLAILSALRHIVRFFAENTFKKGVKAFFQGDDYGRELQANIELIQKHMRNVREECEVCLQERVYNIDKGIRHANKRLYRVELEQAEDRAWLEGRFNNMERMIREAAGKTALDLKKDLFTGFLRLFSSKPGYNPRSGDMEPPEYLQTIAHQRSTTPDSSTAALRKLLLDQICGDPKDSLSDLEYHLDMGLRLNSFDSKTTECIIKSDKFRSWLTSPKSSTLFVNGNLESLDGEESSLSFLCAKMLYNLQIARSVISLYYFCARHVNVDLDKRANARGMMNSLVGQLLSQEKYQFDLSFLDVNVGMIDRLRKEKLDTLCHVFSLLVSQLPPHTTLFCVIDSVYTYEDKTRRQDLFEAIAQLVKLVRKSLRKSSRKATVKLLVTSPEWTQYVESYSVDDKDVLLVEDEDVDEDGQFLNEQSFEDGLKLS